MRTETANTAASAQDSHKGNSMYFDRFDIVQAYYLFYVHYHGGIPCGSYQRLSYIKTVYRPNPSDQHLSGLTDNGRAIYDRLVERFPNAEDSVSMAFIRKHFGKMIRLYW